MKLRNDEDGGLDFEHPVVDLGLVLLLVLLVGMFLVSLTGDGDLPVEESDVEGRDVPSVVYDVQSQGIFPYEHTVEPGENVGIYNELDEEVSLTSDTAENRTVEPGDYTVYSLDRISYFEVNGSDGRVGRLKVNVQRP
jgi:hypothetical protein